MQNGVLSFLKFISAIILLPIVIAISICFQRALLFLGTYHDIFFQGILTYLIFHLFIYTPQGFFQFGQKAISEIFRGSSILTKTIPLIIPLFTTLILFGLYICESIESFSMDGLRHYFIFFISFTMSMHIILTAQDLYENDHSMVKANYLYAMSLVYIINLNILVFLLSLTFHKISYYEFFNDFYSLSRELLLMIYYKLCPLAQL